VVPFYLLDIVLQAYCNIFDRRSAVSVRINEKEYNTLSLQLDSDNKPTGGFGRNKQNEFHLKENKSRDLRGLALCWG